MNPKPRITYREVHSSIEILSLPGGKFGLRIGGYVYRIGIENQKQAQTAARLMTDALHGWLDQMGLLYCPGDLPECDFCGEPARFQVEYYCEDGVSDGLCGNTLCEIHYETQSQTVQEAYGIGFYRVREFRIREDMQHE